MIIFSKLWLWGDWQGIEGVITDKGYDFYKVCQLIRTAKRQAVIPRRQGAVCPGVRDKEKYKTRVGIEHFFGKIKENRCLALRFDKMDITFFSFFALACRKTLNLLLLTAP